MFTTKTDSKHKKKILTVIFAVLALAVLPAVLVSISMLALLEGGVVFTALILFGQADRSVWTIYLKTGEMTLSDPGFNNTYKYRELKKSDFSFTQSGTQEKNNTGTVKVNGCPYILYDTFNFDEFKSFVEENFE